MEFTLVNNCWKFTSYNREPLYAVGTEAEAMAYRDILNEPRQSDFVEVEAYHKDEDYLDSVAMDLTEVLRDHREQKEKVEDQKLQDLKAAILEGLESGNLKPLDLTALKRMARLRREAKELGLEGYRDLNLDALKVIINEAWVVLAYNPEVYQDLDDYEDSLKAKGVNGSAFENLLEQAYDDYDVEEDEDHYPDGWDMTPFP